MVTHRKQRNYNHSSTYQKIKARNYKKKKWLIKKIRQAKIKTKLDLFILSKTKKSLNLGFPYKLVRCNLLQNF